MVQNILYSLVLLLIVIYLKQRYKDEPLQTFFVWGFLAKIMSAIAFSWLYIHYYGSGDMFNYYNYSSALAHVAYHDFSSYFNVLFHNTYVEIPGFDTNLWTQNRAFFFIKLLSVLNLFSGGSYWVMTNYLSFFSFLGMWQLANVLTKLYPNTKYAALLGFLFFPSMLIWSVGISKESLTMGVIGWSLSRYLALRLPTVKHKAWWLKSILLWAISAVLLLYLKFYYLGILLPTVLSFHFTSYISSKVRILKKVFFQILLFIFLIIMLYIPISFSHQYLSLSHAMRDIAYNHNATYIFSKQNDLIHYWRVNNVGFITLYESFENFGINAPIAFFSGLYRPFIWEADSKLKLLLASENLFVMILSLIALLYWCRFGKKENHLIIFASLFYIMSLCVILAFSSPNFGSLSRYKVGFMPFFIYLIVVPISIKAKNFLDRQLSFLEGKHQKNN